MWAVIIVAVILLGLLLIPRTFTIEERRISSLAYEIPKATLIAIPENKPYTPLGIVKAQKIDIIPPPEIRTLISQTAKKYKVDEKLALSVAECESGLDQFAKNKSSSASGIFQIVRQTFNVATKGIGKTGSVFDPQLNIEAGVWLIQQNGTKDFEESAPCWWPKYRRSLNETF